MDITKNEIFLLRVSSLSHPFSSLLLQCPFSGLLWIRSKLLNMAFVVNKLLQCLHLTARCPHPNMEPEYDEISCQKLCYITWQKDFADTIKVTDQLIELIKGEINLI